MNTTYFNEIDPYAAAWLTNLYPEATIDRRSIVDVPPDDVLGYDRVHWFGGLGGWEYALDLAGWPADRPIWTGSCPCQPFSAAGKRAGTDDARHLWPEFFRLIASVRPECIVGEQVGGTGGRAWLAGVHADLAGIGYQFGAVDLPAACVGAPHIRQRLYWVATRRLADSGVGLCQQPFRGATPRQAESWRSHDQSVGSSALDGRLEHAPSDGRQQRRAEPGERGTEPRREPGRLGDPQCGRLDGHAWRWPGDEPANADGHAGGLADADGDGSLDDQQSSHGRRPEATTERDSVGFWSSAALIPCADGRARRAEPGIFPLAYGLPAALDGAGPISRVGALKGAGNAIVPQVAALFIRAFLDCERGQS